MHRAPRAIGIARPDLVEDGAVIGQALARRTRVQRRKIERHPKRRFDGGAEGDQKIIAGGGQDAAMKAQIGLGIGAAVHSGGVHLAIGPFDAGEIGIRAALGADRAGLRLDDPTHLRELTGEFLAWAFRPGPFHPWKYGPRNRPNQKNYNESDPDPHPSF